MARISKHDVRRICVVFLAVVWGGTRLRQQDRRVWASPPLHSQTDLLRPNIRLAPEMFHCTRNSIATIHDQNGITLIPPDILRTEPVTSPGTSGSMTFGSIPDSQPFWIDHRRSVVLGYANNDPSKVTATTDGIIYTTVVDLKTTPPMSAWWSASDVSGLSALIVIDDVLIVWITKWGIQSGPGTTVCKAYRGTWLGNGWGNWVEIWTSEYGQSIHQQATHRDNELIFGEYRILTEYDPQHRGANVWYCPDVTMNPPQVVKIFDNPQVTPDPPDQHGSHFHRGILDPVQPDVAYACWGDGNGSCTYKLTKPVDWIPGMLWTGELIDYRIGPLALHVADGYLWGSGEGSDIYGGYSGQVVRWDPDDNYSLEIMLDLPQYNPPLASGILQGTPTGFPNSTVIATSATAPFVDAHVDKEIEFTSSKNRFVITHVLSDTEVMVDGDARGESSQDTFDIIEPGGPYQYHSAINRDICTDVQKIEQFYYACIYRFNSVTSNQHATGIYVSADESQTWTALWRAPATQGVHRILGVLNGNLVCALLTPAVDWQIGFLPLPSVHEGTGIIVEKGSSNVLESMFEDMADSFEQSIWENNRNTQGWAQNNATSATITLATNNRMYGSQSLEISSPNYTIPQLEGRWWTAGHLHNFIPQGSMMVLSLWSHADATTHPGWAMLFDLGVNRTGFQYPHQNVPNSKRLAENWNRHIQTVKKIDNNSYVYSWRLVLTHNNTPDSWVSTSGPFGSQYGVPDDDPGMGIYVDALMAEFDSRRWRTLSSTFLPLGVNRPDEIVSASFGPVGDNWTLTFDWHPLEGWHNFRESIPIITLEGSVGSYMELRWNWLDQKFRIEDAVQASASTSQSFHWEHFDMLRCSISSDGTNSVLYVWDPVNGLTAHVAQGVRLNALMGVKLGTNHAESEVGCGRFSNIQVYHSSLTEPQIKRAFEFSTDPKQSARTDHH